MQIIADGGSRKAAYIGAAIGKRARMSPTVIFDLHLVFGYVAWLLCFGTYVWPRLRAMDAMAAQRALATLHSFRFFGLVFILPGFVGNALPQSFATTAAYGDFATGLLAMAALLAVRVRPLFWLFTAAFNLVGTADIAIDYYHGVALNLPAQAGQLGAAYAIVMIYVPLLMIAHGAAFTLMLRRRPETAQARTA
jgi:hypothetical protein